MSEVAIPAVFSPPADAPPAPPNPESPAVITAEELVAEVCANAGPIRYREVTVRGALELKSRDFSHRLELRDVTFEGHVDLRDSRFRKTVDLRGCTFNGGVRMEGTRVEGSLLMSGVTVHPLEGDNRGRAARLSLLKVGGHFLARGLEAHGGLDLTRAGVRGHLDLSSRPGRRTWLAGSVVMNVARVGGNVRLCGALVDGDLEAEAVRVSAYFIAGPLRERPDRDEGAVLEITHIRGKTNLSGARITGEMDFTAARVDGTLGFQAAEIRGGLFCRTMQGHQPEIGGSVDGPGARILTTLDLSGARISQNVRLDGATIRGTVFLRNGWTMKEGPPAWWKGDAPVTAPREPDLRTRIGGRLLMSHAKVGGDVSVQDAWLQQDAALTDAAVSGAVSFSQSTVGDDIMLEAATIAGGFYCRCVDGLRPEIGGSIKGNAARIGAGIFMSGAVVKEDVGFAGARVGGPVEMDAKCISSPGHAGEEMHGADAARSSTPGAGGTVVLGTIQLGQATVAGALEFAGLVSGGIFLEGAAVTGSLELADARIGPPYDPARGLPDPDADAMLRTAGESRKAVDATGLRLQGAVRLAGVRMIGDLDLQTARVDNGLFCGARFVGGRLAGERPVIGGSVLLGGATILAEADFRAAWIAGDLSLERATVDGRLRCRLLEPTGNEWRAHLCTRVRGLNLRNCTVDYLDLQGVERRGGEVQPEGGAGTAQGVPILLEGCQFRELSVPGGGEKEKDYLFLFRTHEGRAFRQSNYILMEHWLRDRGEDEAAERVYRLMRERRRTSMRNRHQRAGDWLVCALRAAAMHFQSLIVAALVVYCLSVAIFRDRNSVVAEGARTSASAKWSTTDAFIMAAQVHLPMFTLPGKAHWEPAPKRIRGTIIPLRYDAYAMVISLLSYTIIPLVLGGIATTWLRRGKSGA